MTPTQRTIRYLKDLGMKCAIVEKFNPYVGPYGIRQDLFGIIDIIALDPIKGVVGIQSTGTAFSQHRIKLLDEKNQDVFDWLNTPGASLQLIGWRKVKLKRGGKATRYMPRIADIILKDGEIEFIEHGKKTNNKENVKC